MVSEQECKAKGGVVKEGRCVVEEGGITKPLKMGGFADQSIVPFIDRLNAKGCPTVASCSGLKVDHHGKREGAYLSAEMPNHVVKGGFDLYSDELDPRRVKKPEVVKCFLDAGDRANWLSELGLYLLMVPVVRYALPETKTIENDRKAKSQPEVVAAEKELDRVMGHEHSFEEFMTVLKARDKVLDAAYDRYGRKSYTDQNILDAWGKLEAEVAKCCSRLT